MNLSKKSRVNDLVPSEFYLSQNYPNPVKDKTIIKYCVAYKTRVKITVFNSEDEMIEKLIDEEKNAGTYEIEFDASTCHSGECGNLPEGTYYYKLEAGSFSSKKEMTLLK